MQWLFRKRGKKLRDSGILQGMTDWHSHILPGVDDGVATTEESLSILEFYEMCGIREVWLTPHIMEDIPNNTAMLQKRFELLRSAYTGNIHLHLSAENMLDNLFEERLKSGDLLPLGKNANHLLIETSYFNPPESFWSIIDKIKAKGYYPILAHPERYTYLNNADYTKLKRSGILFQLNIASLTGLYGKLAQKKAGYLLNEGCYELIGSDIHNLTAHQTQFDVKLGPETIKLIKNVKQKSDKLDT